MVYRVERVFEVNVEDGLRDPASTGICEQSEQLGNLPFGVSPSPPSFLCVIQDLVFLKGSGEAVVQNK